MDGAAPELEKSGARKNRNRGETRRSNASRIPPIVGFHRKTRQTRRFAAGRGFLRCDCGWNTNSQPTRSRRRSVEGEETTTLARYSVLRVQCRYSALARFQWLNFGDQEDTQSRKRSDEKGRCMRHGLALGMLALWRRLGRSSQDVPTQTSPPMTLPQEGMTSGRTVEIANGQ